MSERYAPDAGLVERLRNDGSSWAQGMFNEAADALTSQAAKIAELEREKTAALGLMDGHSVVIKQLEARNTALEKALKPLLSIKARELLRAHAEATCAMNDRNFKAIGDAIKMLLEKDEIARAALADPAP